MLFVFYQVMNLSLLLLLLIYDYYFFTLLSANEVILRFFVSLLTVTRCCFDEGVLRIDVISDLIYVSFFFFFCI